MREEMERDPTVFLIGEEVGHFHGPYRVSDGLFEKFGAMRVRDTPIVEAGFTGLGVGAALIGLRPIVEFMTWNFALQSADHIINSAGKLHHMSAGNLTCPIVFRGPNGPATAVAAQHSQCFATFYSNVPGLVTLAPYDSEDCRGMLKAAIRDSNPVVFLENENLYVETFDTPEYALDKDFLIPFGKAKIMVEGKDVSLISYSENVKFCIEAAQALAKEGISCEVVNLRSIKPIDRNTIIESAKKTGKVITVENGFPQFGVGAEIVAIITESEAFDYLDKPIARLTSADIPMAYSETLENYTTPSTETVIRAVRKILQ